MSKHISSSYANWFHFSTCSNTTKPLFMCISIENFPFFFLMFRLIFRATNCNIWFQFVFLYCLFARIWFFFFSVEENNSHSHFYDCWLRCWASITRWYYRYKPKKKLPPNSSAVTQEDMLLSGLSAPKSFRFTVFFSSS